jgi:PAS domain S-box-containing protein
MYFQFAIVQLHILNDPVAYELYIGKMKSILEINKVYQKNFSNSDDGKNSDLTNFIIVDANGSRFGQIIQANNSLRLLLGWSEQELLRSRIESFMPSLIREKHPEFMNRYNKTGQSYIINNKVTMFIKKSNGYVIPVELYIKFHYSIDYQYTFLAIIKPFFEMAPYGNGLKYNIDQLIFLLVDCEGGRITEYSESCSKLLSNYGFQEEIERNGIIKQVSDIVIDFDYERMRRTRQERYVTNQIYENVHTLDLN